jgi:Tfp pilus assembly protein PilF
MVDAVASTPEGITQKGSIFSQKRREAIEMMNAGTKALAGGPGVPPNQAMAFQLTSSAVALDPTMAFGWFQLANTNSDLKLIHGALAAYRRALQLPDSNEIGGLDPVTKAKTYCNLSHTLYHLGRHDEALAMCQTALELKPDEAYSWTNLSMIQSVMGRHEEAIAAALEGHRLEPQNPTVEVGVAFAYLQAKQYAKGLKHMEARFPYKLTQFLHYPYPKWSGELGKRLFIVADQGLGDTMDFLRFVPMAAERAAHVTLAIQPELLRLVQDIFGKNPKITPFPIPAALPAADFWVSTTSLPVPLGLTDQDIAATPYPEITTFFPHQRWKLPGKKLHVAVAWGGSPLNDVDKYRTIEVRHFLEFARVPDTQFYSLQVGPRSVEAHNLGSNMILNDITPHISDVTDTIAILRHMDLVICCDTALGHIAGLIGKEAWIALSFNGCDWRFGRDGDGSLWYPNHKAYRQGMDMRWEPVFDRMIEDLTERVSSMEARNAA